MKQRTPQPLLLRDFLSGSISSVVVVGAVVEDDYSINISAPSHHYKGSGKDRLPHEDPLLDLETLDPLLQKLPLHQVATRKIKAFQRILFQHDKYCLYCT